MLRMKQLVGGYWTVCILLLVSSSSYGQEDLNELTVDRPGIADTPYTVPVGQWQMEVGFDYFNRFNGDHFHLPTALLRTGISRRSEIRVSTVHVLDRTETNAFQGVSPIVVGLKMHIIEKNKWIPETDLMVNISVPTHFSAGYSTVPGPEILLLFENDFSSRTAINYNLGMIWDSFRGSRVLTYSMCFNYLPNHRVGLFAEGFGYAPLRDAVETGMDGGMTYLLFPHWQLDLSAGLSYINGRSNQFVSTGFTVRFK
jgi:hypothetical protein